MTITTVETFYPETRSCSGAPRRSDRGRLSFLTLWATLVLWPPAASAQNPPTERGAQASEQHAATVEREEGERPPAAQVVVGGEPIISIVASVGAYTPEQRAQRIGERLRTIIRDRSIPDLHIDIVESEGSSELRIGRQLVMVVTKPRALTIRSMSTMSLRTNSSPPVNWSRNPPRSWRSTCS